MLVIVFGVGIFSFFDQLKQVWNCPEIVKQNVMLNNHHEKINELFWQFARNMTDDTNKTRYYISIGDGTDKNIHEVDIRSNNEGYQMAFVYDLWAIYPVRPDPADSTRLEVDFHNPRTGEDKYIPLIPQP